MHTDFRYNIGTYIIFYIYSILSTCSLQYISYFCLINVNVSKSIYDIIDYMNMCIAQNRAIPGIRIQYLERPVPSGRSENEDQICAEIDMIDMRDPC